ncbi:MAG: DinB family protein [Anaerolineae bacterium]|nr:DinB family protein [Anaerolineae bacterium]
MSKQDIIQEVKEARASLLQALDGLSEEHMRRAGAVGIWSIKDVLAHLAACESELVTALNQASPRHAPAIVEIEDQDEWNDEQYHISVRRPFNLVWDDFQQVHLILLQMLEDYPERNLMDNRRFPWMEGEPLAYLVQELASWHEQDHAEDICAWREQQGL